MLEEDVTVKSLLKHSKASSSNSLTKVPSIEAVRKDVKMNHTLQRDEWKAAVGYPAKYLALDDSLPWAKMEIWVSPYCPTRGYGVDQSRSSRWVAEVFD
jgi:hypothetical protein